MVRMVRRFWILNFGFWILNCQLLTINYYRHWPVIHKVYLHVGAETASFHMQSVLFAQHLVEIVVQRFRHFGASRFDKTGAVAFAGVAIQGELRDAENLTANFCQ